MKNIIKIRKNYFLESRNCFQNTFSSFVILLTLFLSFVDFPFCYFMLVLLKALVGATKYQSGNKYSRLDNEMENTSIFFKR